MENLATVIEQMVSAVADGSLFAKSDAVDGYHVRVQRTSRWNTAKQRIVIHVWHNGRLLRKAEWQAAVAAPEAA